MLNGIVHSDIFVKSKNIMKMDQNELNYIKK